MKKLTFTLAALVALTVSVSSCKKDTDSPTPSTPAAQTKTQILTSHSWITKSMVSNNVDFYAFAPACEKDNFLTFKANGTSTYDEGAIKCDPSDPQVENGTWKFIANETKIIIDNEDTAEVMTLTAESMVIKTKFESDGGQVNTVVSTFSKK